MTRALMGICLGLVVFGVGGNGFGEGIFELRVIG